MWETFNPTSTSPTSVTNITGWNYTYENEVPNNNATQSRGLKLTSSLYNGSGTNWNLDHTENYGYEAQRGFLTSAAYNDGQPNASATWTYNEAQNRNDTVTNDLNQASYFSGGTWNSYTDTLGQTLTRGTSILARTRDQDGHGKPSTKREKSGDLPCSDPSESLFVFSRSMHAAMDFIGNRLVLIGRMFMDPTNFTQSALALQLIGFVSDKGYAQKFGEDSPLGQYLNAITKHAAMMGSAAVEATNIGNCNAAISAVTGYEIACEGVLLMMDSGDSGGDWGFTVGTPT